MRGDCYKYGANSGKVYSEQVIASRECKDETGAFTLDTTLEDKQPGDPLLTINVPETGDIKVESKIAEDQAKVFAKDAFEVERI